MDQLITLAFDHGGSAIRGALVFIVATGVAIGISALARRFAAARFSPAQAEVASRLVFWIGIGIGVLSALREFGFDLSILMGAAGLLTVALGFASQTSASNVISGLFLLFERPFSLGDTIRVGTTTGEVVSIDLLSVRLRTFDNLLVRVPNETLLKSEITNLSHFPLRRYDLVLAIDVRHDLDEVREVLFDTANADSRVLDEPSVVAHFLGFTDRGAEIQLSVWTTTDSWVAVKNSLPMEVHRALRDAGLPLPPPRREIEVTQR